MLIILCIVIIATAVFIRVEIQNNIVETHSSSLSEVEKVFDSSSNSVYFMHPEDNPGDQMLYDTAMNLCRNQPQVEVFYKLNDLYVDSEGLPRPNVFSHGESLIFIGGPYSQPCVEYFEQSHQAPCSFAINSSHVWWEKKDGSLLNGSVFSISEFDEHHDVFLLEFFIDSYGRNILTLYGYGWRGTWIAVEYLSKTVLLNASKYDEAAYVFRWTDSNNDGIPAVEEVSASLEKFVSIQVTLQSTVNLTRLEWLAQEAHQRELRVTWYIGVYSLDSGVVSLLKDYMAQGDSVQLSFGYGAGSTDAFFNRMIPEERLQYVDRCMGMFKRTFGYYPSSVESYYIDADTLHYISLKYQSVKGAIAYVNHEVFTDGFCSAGAYYMPYYPSRRNTLLPSQGEDKIDIVTMPFIQRDIGNCVLGSSVNYGLSPQDRHKVSGNGTSYFSSLFDSYITGWDQFGLALYLLDLTYAYFPLESIEEDLTYIKSRVDRGTCVNILDTEFLSWFKDKFQESPSYRWVYPDPGGASRFFEWFFSVEDRSGYADGQLIESRVYDRSKYEECLEKEINPYDNSFPLKA
jgi:hypothetical protein